MKNLDIMLEMVLDLPVFSTVGSEILCKKLSEAPRN
jgi:hypothetical protein